MPEDLEDQTGLIDRTHGPIHHRDVLFLKALAGVCLAGDGGAYAVLFKAQVVDAGDVKVHAPVVLLRIADHLGHVGAKPHGHAVIADDAQSVFQFLVLARLEQIVRHAAVVVDGAGLVLQNLTDMPLKAAEFQTGHAHITAQQHGIDAVFAAAGKRILDAGGGESILHLPIHFLTEMGVAAERISADDESGTSVLPVLTVGSICIIPYE